MTPEEMKFYIDICHSPAAIAIAGGLAGSFITLVVALLKIWHDSRESEKAWQRAEERRKEERAFEKRLQLMKIFSNALKIFKITTSSVFMENLLL